MKDSQQLAARTEKLITCRKVDLRKMLSKFHRFERNLQSFFSAQLYKKLYQDVFQWQDLHRDFLMQIFQYYEKY